MAVLVGGRGLHQHLLPMELVEINFKTVFVAQVAWTFSTSAIKVSLLLLYARLFPFRNFRILAYTSMGMVVLYCVGCLVFLITNCTPFQANFTPWMPGAHCRNDKAGGLEIGVANIVTDVAILSLPMKNVWKLQMPTRTKWAVSALFGIGFVTVIISIIRVISILQIDIHDFTYTAIPADILSALEPTLMIVCTCIPIMRPLFKRFFPSNTNCYGCDQAYVMSDKHVRQGDVAVTRTNGSANIKHKIMSGQPSDGFRRLDGNDRILIPVDEEPSFIGSSRSKTLSPVGTSRTQRGIEIKTDILMERY